MSPLTTHAARLIMPMPVKPVNRLAPHQPKPTVRKVTRFSWSTWACALLLLTTLIPAAWALVNPALQPMEVARRHRVVIAGKLASIDQTKRTLTVSVEQVIIGELEAKELTITLPKPDAAMGNLGGFGPSRADLMDDVSQGDAVVLLLGKVRSRGDDGGLLYHGHEWHDLRSDGKDFTQLSWVRGMGDEMWGMFNGDAGQLARMMNDLTHERAFFPALPFTRFQQERVIGQCPGPVRGVAMGDLDGDGRLDLVATSESGCRVFLQTASLEFTDHTEALGLADIKAKSVSLASVDGNRHVDVLLDGKLFVNQGGKFALSPRLAAAAGESVKVSAFVDLNGDGWPDVLVSREAGGLAAWINPGKADAAFVEVTEQLGLDKPQAGAGMTGFVFPGDWNADGRTDLFYAAGKGCLLIQDEAGVFRPERLDVDLSFGVNDSELQGLTGAGGFAPLWTETGSDLVVPQDLGLALINRRDGKGVDVARDGNEIHLSRNSQLATLAEDLNMDGRVDLLTLTRQVDGRNIFYTNRGYGSYMVDDLYSRQEIMPGGAYDVGHWGAAAGDVDGDGATDLLLGGMDGKLRLLLSDVLANRQPKQNDLSQQWTLCRTAILALDFTAQRGVVGARVDVTDARGHPLAWRRIGDAVLTGCGPAHQARIALREPQVITVVVRWSDGVSASREMKLEPGQITRLRLARPETQTVPPPHQTATKPTP